MTSSLSAAATAPDLLRLLAVPVFAWAAVRDVKTRRVSSAIWIPLSGLGAVLLARDGWVAWVEGGYAWTYDFLLPTAIGMGFVIPLAYFFWWFGGFGGADAKALMVLALLFPTFPRYAVDGWTFPLETTPIGAFSFTILTNAVLVGVTVPALLAVRNAAAGRIAPVMFVGWPVSWDRVPETHGRLLETPDGLTRGGLDLDALRMYLRWRGCTLADVREEPDRLRDPSSLPAEPNPPTDGAVGTGTPMSDGGRVDGDGRSRDASVDGGSAAGTAAEGPIDGDEAASLEDPWGAEAFLEDVEGSAYGTSPADLRGGLEVLAGADRVWISPGTPFVVPIFLGLVIALVYGDLLLGTVL